MDSKNLANIDVGSDFSEGEDDQQPMEVQNVATVQQASSVEVSDALKNKVDNYNFDAAISELSSVIDAATEMYQQLKRIKFDYLVLTCDLHSRIDFPSIMMEAVRKEITSNIPSTKNIDNFNF